MPYFNRLAVASIDGFAGLSASNLKTQTFNPGTTSWTAPSDVNLLVSISGKGQDSYSSTWTYNIYSLDSLLSGMTDTGWTDYSSLYSHFTSRLSTINSGAPSVRSVSNIGTYFIFFNTATNTLFADQNGSDLSYAYGSATLNWTLPTSGAITTSINVNNTYDVISIPYYASGAATTAFGKTFPGGAGGNAASLTSYNDVAVTPGNTYSIVNNGNDVLTIAYYSSL